MEVKDALVDKVELEREEDEVVELPVEEVDVPEEEVEVDDVNLDGVLK